MPYNDRVVADNIDELPHIEHLIELPRAMHNQTLSLLNPPQLLQNKSTNLPNNPLHQPLQHLPVPHKTTNVYLDTLQQQIYPPKIPVQVRVEHELFLRIVFGQLVEFYCCVVVLV